MYADRMVKEDRRILKAALDEYWYYSFQINLSQTTAQAKGHFESDRWFPP